MWASPMTSSGACFTSEYDVERLVYFEMTTDVYEAICREKRIKGWRRSRKIALIEAVNPGWKDLSESWAVQGRDSSAFGLGMTLA